MILAFYKIFDNRVALFLNLSLKKKNSSIPLRFMLLLIATSKIVIIFMKKFIIYKKMQLCTIPFIYVQYFYIILFFHVFSVKLYFLKNFKCFSFV